MTSRHLGEAPVAQNACVVDEDVDTAPSSHCTGDHFADPRLIGHGSGKSDRLAAGLSDLARNLLGSAGIHVVDKDFRAQSGQHQSMGSTQPAAGAGNDRNTPPQHRSGLFGLAVHPIHSLDN